MNEGVGSTSVIVIIVVFIAIVSSYMAYNVNYTKATRLKDKVIAVYERNNGNCTVADCQSEILAYGQKIGYNGKNMNCSAESFSSKDTIETTEYKAPGYCIYKIRAKKSGASNVMDDCAKKPGYYYRVLTRIDINIPVVQNVLGLRFLNVTGDTKVFTDEC